MWRNSIVCRIFTSNCHFPLFQVLVKLRSLPFKAVSAADQSVHGGFIIGASSSPPVHTFLLRCLSISRHPPRRSHFRDDQRSHEQTRWTCVCCRAFRLMPIDLQSRCRSTSGVTNCSVSWTPPPPFLSVTLLLPALPGTEFNPLSAPFDPALFIRRR